MVLVAALVGLLGVAGAAAHVTVTPTSSPAGQPATFTFRVPNEPVGPHAGHEIGAAAVTIRFEVVMPTEHPVPDVTVEAPPGWTAQVREAGGFVRSVSWTGGRISSSDVARFRITTGPLPADTDQLVIQAIQTYNIGVEIQWDDVVGADGREPMNPAPVVTVVGGTPSGTAAATAATNSGSDGFPGAVVAVAVGLVGAGAVAAMAIARRRSRTA